MDILQHILKSDIVDLLDKAKDELESTRAVILIQVMDTGELHTRAINLNDYEVIGILQTAKVQVIDDGEDDT